MRFEHKLYIGLGVTCILILFAFISYKPIQTSDSLGIPDIDLPVSDNPIDVSSDILRDDNIILFYSYLGYGDLYALLKGSIYETDEYIHIYGVCYQASNETNQEFVNANSTIKIFQGNGTTLVYDNMTMLGLGHYVYNWTIPNIQETFLTEMNCSYDDVYAVAWGEIQNPLWTNRIKNLSSNTNYGLTLSMLSFPERIGQYDNFTVYLSYSLTNGTTGLAMNTLNTSILYQNNTILTEKVVGDLQLHRNIYKFEYDLNNTYIGNYYLRVYGEYKSSALLSTGRFEVIEQNESDLQWSTRIDTEAIYKTPINFYTQITSQHNISNIDCDLITNIWGLRSMSRDIGSRSFQYGNILNESGTWTWSVSCYES